MDPLQRAKQLRQEADFVLQQVRLNEILTPGERIVATGSYFLDAMMYPDIDLSLNKVSIERLFQIGGRLATCPIVLEVVFKRSDDARIPRGLYLKPRVAYGNWGRPWKIDIWSVDDWIIEDNMAEMHDFKRKMTPCLREQILRYKYSVLTETHRTPMYSGYFVYKAFLDEGISDFHKVSQYLADNGIRLAWSS